MKSKWSPRSIQMTLKGRPKIDVPFGQLWFHFGCRMDVFSFQDVLCPLGK